MSLERGELKVDIVCDGTAAGRAPGCRRILGESHPAIPDERIIERAHLSGWRQDGQRWACPECRRATFDERMTTDTLTLAEFLLARIAEDEAAARRALGVTEAAIAAPGTPRIHRAAAEKIDLPARRRVLVECEAKRRLVERCRSVLADAPHWSNESHDDEAGILAEATLRLLALPYADHPEFREEWRA